MASIILIYFREFLEISLILGIIAAATKDLKNRILYISTGIAIGIFGSILFALLINKLSGSIDNEFEDIFTSIILLINVITIIYTITYIHNNVKTKFQNIDYHNDNRKLFCTIVIIVATSIIREGIEISLFTYGILISSGTKVIEMIPSCVIGSVIGLSIGFAIYYGIVKLPIKIFFKTIKILLCLLAANLSSQIPLYLDSANIINLYSNPIWDSSVFLSEQSIVGKTIHSITGYTSKPTGMQVVFYLSTLFIIKIISLKKDRTIN